jgi:hypothetical protein
MPGYRNMIDWNKHDMAMTSADAGTVALLDAKDDAYGRYIDAKEDFDKAHNAAYDKAYARLEKQYGT